MKRQNLLTIENLILVFIKKMQIKKIFPWLIDYSLDIANLYDSCNNILHILSLPTVYFTH